MSLLLQWQQNVMQYHHIENICGIAFNKDVFGKTDMHDPNLKKKHLNVINLLATFVFSVSPT